jgi:hypothetical protein
MTIRDKRRAFAEQAEIGCLLVNSLPRFLKVGN